MTERRIEPATIAIFEHHLADLRTRLARTRWPEKEPVDGWTQGAPLEKVRDLCAYWRDRYDWRRCERMLNNCDPGRTVIDGQYSAQQPAIRTLNIVDEFMRESLPIEVDTSLSGRARHPCSGPDRN